MGAFILYNLAWSDDYFLLRAKSKELFSDYWHHLVPITPESECKITIFI
jgi:hypothetical protein